MQIARSSLGPLAPSSLRLRDRWSVLDSVFYWATTFSFRLAAMVYPLLYWFGGVTVVDARLPDVIAFFGAYYLWILIVLNVLSRGMVVPVLNDVSQLIGAWPITRAAFTGLVKPHGHPFSVTAKGGDRSRVVVQWNLMAPFLALFALTLGGLVIGIVSDRFAFNGAGDGKWVILFWSVYNLAVLFMTTLACIELPRRERHVADAPERAVFATAGGSDELWIASLTSETVRLRGRFYPVGQTGKITVRDVGEVEAVVAGRTADGVKLRLHPNPAQREDLMVRLYADDGAAPGIARVRAAGMVGDIARRLSFTKSA